MSQKDTIAEPKVPPVINQGRIYTQDTMSNGSFSSLQPFPLQFTSEVFEALQFTDR